MSIPLLPHSNFLIQSLHAPCFPFSQGKVSTQIQKETKFKKTTTTITRNKKETTHILHKTQANTHKKELSFSHSNPLIPAKKLLKSLHPRPLSRSPQNHFSKTQVHLLSNALAFSFKRQRVFPETLRGFRPNPSAFWLQIRLFKPISPHFLL